MVKQDVVEPALEDVVVREGATQREVIREEPTILDDDATADELLRPSPALQGK